MKSENQTILAVEGMTCGSCVRRISAALTPLSGVSEVKVDLRNGHVLVRHDAEVTPASQLVETVVQAGYGATVRTGDAGDARKSY